MSALTVVTAIGFFALACWRAYLSVRLLSRDTVAWQKQQEFLDARRKERLLMLGTITMKAVRVVKGWLGKESDAEPEEREGLHQGNGQRRQQEARRADRSSGIA